MKLFKQIMAIALVVAMVLSVSVVGVMAADAPPEPPAGGMGPGGPGGSTKASGVSVAKDLKDYASIENQAAVDVLVSAGVINGIEQENGSYNFDPKAYITREAMAKMVAVAVTLASGEEITGTDGKFSDIDDRWSADYVNYCADAGIINGRGDVFDYAGNITVAETAKILAAALTGEQYTGSTWKEASWAAAEEKGILEGIKGEQDEAITRDEAALMIYNALVKADGSKVMPQMVVLAEGEYETVEIPEGAVVKGEGGQRVTLIVDGVEVEVKPGTYTGKVQVALTEVYGQWGSFAGGDEEDYEFRAALYIDEQGINEGKSASAVITGGTYTAYSAEGISVKSTSPNLNSIIVDGKVNYTIKDSTFDILGDSDGNDVNDFSGFGAVVTAVNDATVTLENVTINTTGVARPALFADEYGDIIFKNSRFSVKGGTLYETYINSANQASMVAPPWVLGIGGNSRGTNMEGACSSTTIIDSEVTAAAWGVLSTDAGSDMLLTVIDSVLTLDGSNENYQNDPYLENYGTGYGTYAIGNAQEFFYGATINVGTYATIFTGGYATYASSNFEGGKTSIYPLDTNAEKYQFLSSKLTGFGSDAIIEGVEGKGQVTTINSDGFGFMAHGDAGIHVTDGTVVNTKDATFLMKTSGVEIVVDDGAQINTASGVVLQMIDNDDSIVGMGDMSTMGFNTEFNEEAGWPSENGNVTGGSAKGNVSMTIAGTTVDGNLYNGTGYWGQKASTLDVTLGEGAVLNGDIASTEYIHVDENGEQNTHFTIKEYYYLGRVSNRNYNNGLNTVSVELKDGAVWNVAGESLISKLVIGEGCVVNGTATIDGVETVLEAGKTYEGNIVIAAVTEAAVEAAE